MNNKINILFLFFLLIFSNNILANCNFSFNLNIDVNKTPEIDYSESFSNITNIDREHYLYFPFGSIALGIYLPQSKILISGTPISYSTNNGVLSCFQNLNIHYSINPKILIAKEIKMESECLKNTLLNHEMTHHQIQLDAINKINMRQIIEEEINNKLFTIADNHKLSISMLENRKSFITQIIKNKITNMIMPLQNNHDNHSEYLNIAQSCNGQLQIMLENRWSSYIYK